MNEEYVRRSDVERLIMKRIDMLERNVRGGIGLKNAIINLKALKMELDGLYSVKVAFKSEPPIWRKK